MSRSRLFWVGGLVLVLLGVFAVTFFWSSSSAPSIVGLAGSRWLIERGPKVFSATIGSQLEMNDVIYTEGSDGEITLFDPVAAREIKVDASHLIVVTAIAPKLAMVTLKQTESESGNEATKSEPIADLGGPQQETESATPDLPRAVKESEISRILQEQVVLFKKCHSRVISLGSPYAGKATLQFTIEPSGITRQVRIAESDFESEEFHACLISVLERVKFSPFRGPAVSANFPLSFK